LLAEERSAWLACAAGVAIGIATNYHPLALGFVPAIALLALTSNGLHALRKPQLWLFAVGFILAMVPFVWWISSSPAHQESFRQVWIGRAVAPYSQKLVEELGRYSDFIGLSSVKAGLPFRLPLRAHIVLVIVAAMGVLFRYRRKLAVQLTVVIAANLLWWTYQVNKSPRYCA